MGLLEYDSVIMTYFRPSIPRYYSNMITSLKQGGCLLIESYGIPEMGDAIAKDEASDPAEVLNWCRDRLSHYKCPRTLDWVDDLGRNTMGKINKLKLRAPFWESE